MSDPKHEPVERPSKSQLKRDATALQALGERLVELTSAQLARIPLPAELQHAVAEAQRIRQRGGRRRQLQFIGKLMRQVDVAPIQAAVQAMDDRGRQAAAEHRQAEQWRNRLLAEGDTALAEFLEKRPAADRRQLRQAVRAARRERENDAAARALFRLLRELLEAPTP